jgi:lambda family phage portal protein
VAKPTLLDQVIGYFSPRAGFERARFRAGLETVKRHYEGAARTPRTQAWIRTAGDANAAARAALGPLREHSRDLVRNNAWAANGLGKATGNVVGTGILAKPKWPGKATGKREREAFSEAWNAWAGSSDCDFDGVNDLYGLQWLAVRTMLESGEVLIRRYFDKPGGGIPLKLQVLEPDHLDTEKTIDLNNGNQVIQGVEIDDSGHRVAYWLFQQHPGALLVRSSLSRVSVRVEASKIAHVFRRDRPGQMRGVSAFAPCLVRLKDLDEYEDAALLRQKIAACFAAFVTNEGEATPSVGDPDDSGDPSVDEIYPGLIKTLKPGEGVTFANPPTTSDFREFSSAQLRAVAAGLGITFEQLTGDYSQVNFTSGRMAKVDMTPGIEAIQYLTVIPQLCGPIWRWVTQAMQLSNANMQVPRALWTPPAVTMYDPDSEYSGMQRGVRNGFIALSEAIRRAGYDPDEVFEQVAETNKILDKLGIKLDSDPRHLSQSGQGQAGQGGTLPADKPKPKT